VAAAWATRVAVAAAAATKQAIDPAAAYAAEHAAAAVHAAEYAAARDEWEGGWPALTRRMESVRAWERQAQAALLRCVFGPPPFRPLPALSASLLTWNDSLVPRLAQTAYEERILPSGHLDPDRLAVLADALEDAGCTNAELLGHLRGEGPHWRGCWVVDLVLSRE
jgi:hypothetical protein